MHQRHSSHTHLRRSNAVFVAFLVQFTGHYNKKDELLIALHGLHMPTTPNAGYGLVVPEPSLELTAAAKKTYDAVASLSDTLLERAQAQKVPLYCRIDSDDDKVILPMILLPDHNLDSNTKTVLLWTCNVTQVFTKAELLKRRRTHVQLSILAHENANVGIVATNADSLTVVTQLDLPVHVGGIGYGAAWTAGRHDPVLARSAPIMLCALGGYGPVVRNLREWVVHNLQIGVGIILLGTFDSNFAQVRKELSYWIGTGQVVLSMVHQMAFSEGRHEFHKTVFYQVQCTAVPCVVLRGTASYS